MDEHKEETDRFRAEMDQSIELMGELARALWRFFSDLKEQGFSDAHALRLTVTWLEGTQNTTGGEQ